MSGTHADHAHLATNPFLPFQLYIIFPVLVRTMTANSFSLRIFTVCKTESLKFPMLKPDQVIYLNRFDNVNVDFN